MSLIGFRWLYVLFSELLRRDYSWRNRFIKSWVLVLGWCHSFCNLGVFAQPTHSIFHRAIGVGRPPFVPKDQSSFTQTGEIVIWIIIQRLVHRCNLKWLSRRIWIIKIPSLPRAKKLRGLWAQKSGGLSEINSIRLSDLPGCWAKWWRIIQWFPACVYIIVRPHIYLLKFITFVRGLIGWSNKHLRDMIFIIPNFFGYLQVIDLMSKRCWSVVEIFIDVFKVYINGLFHLYLVILGC